MYKGKDISSYFDSYGIQPLPAAIDFLEEGVYNTFKIQPDDSKMCGILCLYVLYSLHNGKSFYDTVLEMRDFFNS